jgi:hypothetical protein
MTSQLRKKVASGRARGLFQKTVKSSWSILLLVLFVPFSATTVLGAHAYRTVSTVSPRPMAMGGAFVSVEDDLAALSWNPAGFILYQKDVSHRLSVHINPVIPVALLHKDHQNVGDFLAALGTALRGITYSHRWAEIGLLLWEEPFYNPAAPLGGRFFDADDILNHCIHTLGFRARLASTVSLGSTGNLYRIRNELGKSVLAGGANYGVLLKPARGLEVGLAYFDFPSSVAQLRWEMEGLRDESVNAGISFHPDGSTIVAMDFRDATGEEKIGWNRFRFGFERTLWECLSLRLGYFQAGPRENDVYSFGLGLFGGDIRDWGIPHCHLSSCLANYTLLLEEGDGDRRFWHLLYLKFCL